MAALARMPLEGGGAILFEDVDGLSGSEGPVKAGRLGERFADAVHELPGTLQDSLAPVRETARAVLDQLRAAGPHEAEVEFGVNLSAKAGAVITGGEAAVHLKVRLVWKREPAEPEPSGPAAPEPAAPGAGAGPGSSGEPGPGPGPGSSGE